MEEMMELNLNTRRIVFLLAALLCLMPFMSPPPALLMGLVLAQLMKHPYLHLNRKATGFLLKVSVIGLGFGMNVFSALKAGREGFLFTVASIFGVLILGFLLGRIFKIESKIAFLVSSGTAICGGSAIAALSPVLNAGEKEVSVSLGIVFILNSAALFLFPAIGHLLGLSQSQFGMWCAIAIHDTSAVVGAAGKYGEQALQIATTVKLARALWIIPVALGTAFAFNSNQPKVQLPYFIGLFILAMLASTFVPFVKLMAPYMVMIAKSGLTLTLFLIGSGLSLKAIRIVGIKPFLQGLILWIAISCASLWAVMSFV